MFLDRHCRASLFCPTSVLSRHCLFVLNKSFLIATISYDQILVAPMKIALRSLFFAAVLSMLAATNAIANPITFSFSGFVYAVDTSISGAIPNGSKINGSYTFKSDAIGQSFAPGGILDPSITYYPNVLTAFHASIGSYSVDLGGENRIFVINDSSSGLDRYLVELLQPSGVDIGGLPIHDFFLSFQDPTAKAIANGSLPLLPSIVASFPLRAGALDFVTGIEPKNRATFSIETVTFPASNVPEPTTIALLSLGLIGFAVSRRA